MVKALACLLLLAVPAQAAEKSDFIQNVPVQIDAKNGIECDKGNKICKAFNATVTHGDITLKGNMLKVFFDEKDGLQRLEAYGNVVIISKNDYRAHGSEGSFDMKKGIAILKKSAKALDLKKDRSLQGERIVIKLHKDKAGKMDVTRVDAYDNVEVKTPTEVAKSDKGTYVAGKDFVTLAGHVRITTKDGQIRGDTAEMNLKTGVSRIKSSKAPVKVYLNAKPKGTDEKVKS